MLKRILLTAFGLTFLLTMAVSASVDVQVTDELAEKITVSGDAAFGTYVSVMMTNPGYTYEQAIAGESGAVQYFGGKVAGQNGYSFEIPIRGPYGGVFKVHTDIDGTLDVTEISYYTASFKVGNIKAINGASDANDLLDVLDNMAVIFSLADNPLFKDGDATEIAKSIIDVRDSLDDKAFSEDVEDIAETSAYIVDALVLAAFNAGKSDLAAKDGRLMYADRLGILDTEEYADYTTYLSAEGIANVNGGMMKCGFDSFESAKRRFNELVYYNVLMNYSMAGYGHIHGYFNKYNDAYEDAGFNIPSKSDRDLYQEMLELDSADLTELADDFNELRDELKDSGNTSGGSKGSGGGGGFSGGGNGIGISQPVGNVSGTQPPVSYIPPMESTTEDKNHTGFDDVKSDHWAYESITALAKDSVIKGYEDGSFRPDGKITRGEFAAIIRRAFDLNGTDEAFEDVTADDWYYTAVASLASTGLITGDGTMFRPGDTITRQDAAVIIYRYLGKGEGAKPGFADADKIAQYAIDAVGFLSSEGIINGYTDDTFRPFDSISRAEAAKIIYTCILKEAE